MTLFISPPECINKLNWMHTTTQNFKINVIFTIHHIIKEIDKYYWHSQKQFFFIDQQIVKLIAHTAVVSNNCFKTV